MMKKTIYFIFMLVAGIFIGKFSFSQNTGQKESISKYRKGEIIVKADPGAKVEIEQLSHEFWFGCAVTNNIMADWMPERQKKKFKEKFLENFNSAVTENAVKWANMEPKQGEINYHIVDGILEWAEEADIPLRGHNIFWGVPRFVQDWVKELDDKELEETLKNRAETIAEKYKGRFAEYDLNNEMIHGNYYEQRLGPGITKKMADWFLSKDPEAKLFLNDYDILTGNALDKYLTQIRYLLKQGVPIAGIGVQGHLHGETFDREELKRSLDSLAQFGLPIRITEFNMPGQRSKYYSDKSLKMTPEEEEIKARELVDYYTICFAHPAVEGILMWGFWEGANWIPESSLYKQDWSPTPALNAYQDLIFNQWWTKESGATNSEGVYSVPAFFGKYKVTVNGVSQTIDLKKADKKTFVEIK